MAGGAVAGNYTQFSFLPRLIESYYLCPYAITAISAYKSLQSRRDKSMAQFAKQLEGAHVQ